ncbi:MAG TPA: thiamine diphosphokinase [Candidatus Limnocylindria bacterium]|nr:thiamine diphosphokinase [Candidatus Limnocylindria bacterium]
MLVIVVADGEPEPGDAGLLVKADLLIAADGGARWVDAVGSRPDLIVGDLDSVDAGTLDRLVRAGSRLERHATEKDESDTELALAAAVAAGADRIVLLGALRGRRLDHELANLLLLLDPRLASRDLRIVCGPTQVRAVRGETTLGIEATIGETVSLLPIGGDAIGVTTHGLRFPLAGGTLTLGGSRGLSNVVTETPASVRLEGGSLLVVETRNTMEGEA